MLLDLVERANSGALEKKITSVVESVKTTHNNIFLIPIQIKALYNLF